MKRRGTTYRLGFACALALFLVVAALRPVAAQLYEGLPFYDNVGDPGPAFWIDNLDGGPGLRGGSVSGPGVYGYTADSANTGAAGVYGTSDGPSGWGGYFRATGNGGGVAAVSVNSGALQAYSTNSTAVYAVSNNGLGGDFGTGNLHAEALHYSNGGTGGQGWLGGAAGTYGCSLTGTVWVDQTVSAAGFITRSDARLKKHIQPLPHSLDAILRLRGVSFEWKKRDRDTPRGPQIGFIAQEVEKVLPSVVSKEVDGIRSVNYSAIVPVLVEAMKEEHKRIAAVGAENRLLRAQLTSLSDRIARMESAGRAVAAAPPAQERHTPVSGWAALGTVLLTAGLACGRFWLRG